MKYVSAAGAHKRVWLASLLALNCNPTIYCLSGTHGSRVHLTLEKILEKNEVMYIHEGSYSFNQIKSRALG
jgi:hypothetical protein